MILPQKQLPHATLLIVSNLRQNFIYFYGLEGASVNCAIIAHAIGAVFGTTPTRNVDKMALLPK